MEKLLFGKYEIIRRLGQGGSGEVYLARDIHVNRLSAVKLVPKGKAVEQEAELLKDLSIPGLPEIYDIRESEDRMCLVMEYVDGTTLRAYLDRNRRVPAYRVVMWAKELLDILEALHTHKPAVIYRDLKPSNIMLTGDGKLRLIDFGGALVRNYSRSEEQSGFGTRNYSAPEIFAGKMADPSSDLYSLGAVLYELLTGEAPRAGIAEKQGIRNLARGCPRSLERIVQKCLKTDRAERYRSAADVRADLEGIKKLGLARELLRLGRILLLLIAYLTAGVAFFCYAAAKSEGYGDLGIRLPVLLCASAVLLTVCLKGKKKDHRFEFRTEKDIFLTDKKRPGLTVPALLLLFGAAFLLGFLSGNTKSVYAAGEARPLWVELRDPAERKLLLKEEEALAVSDKVRIEIPAEELPDRNATLKIVLRTADGLRYESRDFKITR